MSVLYSLIASLKGLEVTPLTHGNWSCFCYLQEFVFPSESPPAPPLPTLLNLNSQKLTSDSLEQLICKHGLLLHHQDTRRL